MKKTFALICTLAMLLTSIPAGAFELENVESSAETAVETTVAETAEETSTTTSYTITMDVPGKNVLTGTEALLDFEGEATAIKAMFSGGADAGKTTTLEINSNTDIDDPEGVPHGNMLAFTVGTGVNPWATVNFTNATIKSDRKYYIHLEEYTDSTGDLGNAWGCIQNLYGSSHQNIAMGLKKWATWNQVVSAKANAKLNFRIRGSQATTNVDATAPTSPVTYYWDNLGFYPFYKIGYADKDGNVTYDQILFEEGATWSPENFATEYTIKTEGDFAYQAPFSKDGKSYTQIGWSTDSKATEGMTTVELENKDILLLPVYSVETFLTIDNSNLSAVSGTKGTITAKEPVEWSYVKVNDVPVEVSISDDKKTFTVTATGGTGIVDVVAVAENGVEYEASLVITGAGSWWPGLNWLTRSDRPLDIEQDISAGLNIAFGSGASKVTDNTNKGGTNFSNKVFKLTGGDYPSLWMREFDETKYMDVKRPLYISYDYYSEKMVAHWIMINGSSGNDIFQSLGSTYGDSATWKTVKLANVVSGSSNKYTLLKKLGIEAGNQSGVVLYLDNLMFVPYYKITYKSADGETELGTKYYLLDADGKIATKYPIDKTVAPSVAAYSLTIGGPKVDEVPLNYQDITLYALGEPPASFFNGEVRKDVDAPKDVEFTFPTPEQAGFENVENFVAWIDVNDKPHFPGEKVAADKITSTLQGQNFTAWCQDLTQPAVGFAAEGTEHNGTSKIKYAEAIEDEGRSVIHFHQYLTSYNADKKIYESDARIHFTCREGDNPGFDATEYNIIQYAAKSENLRNVNNTKAPAEMTDNDLTARDAAGRSFYYYTANTGDGYYKDGANRLPDSSGNNTAYSDGKYHVVEWDMSNSANFGAKPWTAGTNGKIYGFAIDPASANGAGDTYIDYIRVYRDGYLTVTYDTNAPGGKITHEVAPDTGRGGGTNYLLKGDVPTIESVEEDNVSGYRFIGWALSLEDADAGIVVDAIPTLSRDTTVYASWAWVDDSPAISDNLGIRSDSVQGVRFKATISSDARAAVSGYGYLVARKDVLGDNELTFDFKDETVTNPALAPKYVVGVAYDKAKGIDKQLSVDDDGNVTFSAVCINIPEAHYATKLVARTYINYDVTGNAFTLYGTSVTTSLWDAAKAVKDADDQTEYNANKAYIDEILSK